MTLHHISAAVALLLAAPALDHLPAQGRALDTAAPNARVDSLFTSVIRPDGPGCAVGVYRSGEIVLAKGYGVASVETGQPITAHTTFNIGSVSKPFTALALLILERDGKLSLDDDIRRWIPEMPDYGTPIRVRDLLQHTSGLRDYGALNTLAGRSVTTVPGFLARMAAQRALNFPTGSRHEYSHSDFELLGLLIERATGTPFGEHLEREVLRPMGMTESFIFDERPRVRPNRAFGHQVTTSGSRVIFPSNTVAGGSNLNTSVTDLARFDRNFDQPIVGGAGVITRMLSRPTLASGDTIPYAYGLRLDVRRGLRTVERGGHDGGTLSEIIRFPEQRLTVAVLCNAEHLAAGRLAERVAAIYLGSAMRPATPIPAPPAAVTVTAAELQRYAGVYRPSDMPWMVVPIEVRNGTLVEVLPHEMRDDTTMVMTPAGEGRFFEIGATGNVGLFSFSTTPGGGPMRLAISWSGGPPEELERVPDSLLWRPGRSVSMYQGTWYSQDLDAVWKLVTRDDRHLVLRRQGLPDHTLLPVARDVFTRGFGPWASALNARIEFHRNAQGAITHFTVSTPPGQDSAVGVAFNRVGEDAALR
ncbi:MAG: serine hydrolase [Gemmatimonadales bacterium]|nr:serine hydrolase [Gemmatimonadales bacterium]